MGNALPVHGEQEFRPHIDTLVEVGLESRRKKWPGFRRGSSLERGHGTRVVCAVVSKALTLFGEHGNPDTGRHVRMGKDILEELVHDGARKTCRAHVSFDVAVV